VTTHRTWAICDAVGDLQAVHHRWDPGKRLAWSLPEAPERVYGLDARRVDSLPLYGSERVAAWPLDAWIIVTEGETDADALTACDVPALATVTGATIGKDRVATPTVEALSDVARGRRFVTWPDNDHVGRVHMSAVAVNLYRAGAVDVRGVVYRPASVDWPAGAGARDLIGGMEPTLGAYTVTWLLEEWTLPVAKPGPIVATWQYPARVRDLAPRNFGSVSDALAARGITNARPGRTVRCPNHEDRSASLSILRDDQRAICKAASCEWSGRGVIAADVLTQVPA
jgi:hypothetical protein